MSQRRRARHTARRTANTCSEHRFGVPTLMPVPERSTATESAVFASVTGGHQTAATASLPSARMAEERAAAAPGWRERERCRSAAIRAEGSPTMGTTESLMATKAQTRSGASIVAGGFAQRSEANAISLSELGRSLSLSLGRARMSASAVSPVAAPGTKRKRSAEPAQQMREWSEVVGKLASLPSCAANSPATCAHAPPGGRGTCEPHRRATWRQTQRLGAGL
ncbi:MAG: hypothetical protein RLY20_301 [Verrucomicrobiota bacterium]